MASQARAERPEMPVGEYAQWREQVSQCYGIDFAESRARQLCRALWERARRRGAASYGEYRRLLSQSPGDEGEWRELLELLVNRETSFFRHRPSYDYLCGEALPELLVGKRQHGVRTLTLASFGCSTGEEAYSLAMSALAAAPHGLWQTLVFALDISPLALEKARRGRYRARAADSVPAALRQRFIAQLAGEGGAACEVREEVRRIVRFGRANLADEESWWPQGLDVIFCHNVLVYFQAGLRLETARRLGLRLNPGGYLFLAPGEIAGARLPGLEPVRAPDVSVYRRLTAGSGAARKD